MLFQQKQQPQMQEILWQDLRLGDRFLDGSQVVELHDRHREFCYELHLQGERSPLVLSQDHLLLADLDRLQPKQRMELTEVLEGREIPRVYNQHLWFLDGSDPNKQYVEYELLESDPHLVDGMHAWLPVSLVVKLLEQRWKLRFQGKRVQRWVARGELEVFCVSTDTGQYQTAGYVHHNSVMLRNIIFHAITHSQDLAIALVDFKRSEFECYKGMKGVVAVANTTQEAVEIMRVARAVMYKRNEEIAARGVQNMDQIIPQKPTDQIFVAGRTFHENQKLQVRVDGEEREMTAGELEQFLKQG